MNVPPRRITIIGSCGAGKSTLAAELGRRLGLPVLHRDRVMWTMGWVERPLHDYADTVRAFAAGDQWIIEGNFEAADAYSNADLVIWLDFPTWRCLWNITKRVVRWNGRTRPDMAQGCPERWDWEFMEYVANFNRDRRPRLVARVRVATCPVRVFAAHAQVDSFLEEVRSWRP